MHKLPFTAWVVCVKKRSVNVNNPRCKWSDLMRLLELRHSILADDSLTNKFTEATKKANFNIKTLMYGITKERNHHRKGQ